MSKKEVYNKLSLADKCLYHKFLYYVLCESEISDYEYDILEKEARRITPENHIIHSIVGSEYTKDYPQHIIDLINMK